MKSLETIQKLAKIGHILSRIISICSLVGACLCLVGTLLLALGAGALLKFTGGSFAWENAVAVMLVDCIVCIGQYVPARFARDYFALERAAGTPFTIPGADALKKLGILTICVPLGCNLLAVIVLAVMEQLLGGGLSMSPDCGGSIALGIMLLVTSLLCRYGAEVTGEAQ